MKEFEKLALQKEKIKVLIQENLALKKQILDLLMVARKEISEMNVLITRYPNSEKIPERMEACDDVLAKCIDLLSRLETKFIYYQEVIKKIDEVLTQGGDNSPGYP